MDFKYKAIISGAIGCVLAVTLVACGPEPDVAERTQKAVSAAPSEQTRWYRPICVEGVQYWQGGSGNGTVVFPRYESSTRKVATCHGAELP